MILDVLHDQFKGCRVSYDQMKFSRRYTRLESKLLRFASNPMVVTPPLHIVFW